MTPRITFTKGKDDEWPVCPSCKHELKEIKYKKRGWIAVMTTFWCPHCRSLLSASTTFNG
jgi:hypothetical protein